MSSQSTSLREECRALDESSEFISWFRRHFPTVPSEVIKAFEENTITGDDFLEMDERDFKEVFPRLAHRKMVKGIYNCLNGSVSDPLTPGFTKVPKPSTSQNDSFTDDDESELSFQSTLTLNSSSSGDASDVSCSSQNKRTSTPIPPKVSCAPVSVQGKTSPDLPSDFIIPSKFGKITDGNLKSGNLSDVDRAKVIKTVATCVWVHTDSPSPGCCEWLAKQLISKYPTLADADPRKMLQTVPTAPKEDFKYWHSLKKGLMKKFENWRYRENKRSPDFLEQKAKKKKKTEEENVDSDPAAMERNIKRLKEEQSKSRNQDATVLQNLLSVTFGTRHQQLLQVSDGKTRVSKLLKDWPILGKEIYFREEVSRALSKANVPVSDFTVIEDNWKKVIPNIMYMLGDVCTEDNSIPTVNFVSDEGSIRVLKKFVGEKEARDAISNDTTLPEELVEVLPSEWNLEDDELPVVPHLKKYFTDSAWVIVEDGLKHLKQKANNSGKEINALLSLTKLFPGLRKLKNTGSDFVVNVAENGKSVTEFLKKPPSTSPYIIISKRGNGWQTFLACGGNSILETTTISTGVAALIGSYFLFNFEYPPEAKGAFLFLQEYLLNAFVNQRHSKYAAALVRYQTAAMKSSSSPMASKSAENDSA